MASIDIWIPSIMSPSFNLATSRDGEVITLLEEL